MLRSESEAVVSEAQEPEAKATAPDSVVAGSGGVQARYDELVEQAPDAILVHVGGRIVLANSAAVHLAGAERAGQLVGRLITEFLMPPFLKGVQAQLVAGSSEAPVAPIPDSFRRLDGSAVDVEVTAIPFLSQRGQPSAHLVIRDMTERSEARASQAVATSQLRLLLNQLPALVWTADLSLRMTSMQGMREDLLTGDLTKDSAFVAAQHRALGGESSMVEIECRGRWLETYVEPLYDANQLLVGCLGMTQDVTVRKVAEAHRATDQKDAVVGTLAGGVAHEVNNMMAVVLGFSELLLANPRLPEDQRGDVLEIRRAAERATAVTSQLLAFSRRGMFHPVVLRVDALVTGAVPLLRQILGDKRPLLVQLACSKSVRVDVSQLELALANLAINARDAMEDGGTLTLAAVQEDVAGALTHSGQPVLPGSYSVLRIRDTGTGMEPDVLAQIFEPFFTTKPQGEGTGLGLAAVAGIFDRNGIPFRVDSTPGEGTTFTLYLPVVADAEPIAPPNAVHALAKQPAYTCLVIDDEDALRRTIQLTLRRQGFAVKEADGGAAALALLEHDGPPDIVLLDLTMPDIDGPELAARIAARWPMLPVLFMSGHTEANVAQLLAQFPASKLIQKPFDGPTLAARLREMLAPVQP